MNRRRQETAGVRISDEEYSRLENKFEALKNEFIACKRKLDSKCEALLILSRELDQCRSERDQFKLMAEQLRERHQSMKKQLSGQLSELDQCRSERDQFKLMTEQLGERHQSMKKQLSGHLSEPTSYLGSKQCTEKQSQNLMKILVEVKDQNKSLHFELEDTKQKLHDAQGDIKLLREQIARQRVGTTDEGMNTRHFPAHEREELVQKLESSRDQYLQLERDLQTVLDEKEELVTERDVYKTKYERLNQELNYILKGDENRVVDIDALVMENKYLQDRLKQMEAEKSMAMAAVSKYKSILEKKKNKSCMKLGQTRGGGMVISQKQVHEVLTSQAAVVPTPQAMSDLQALAGALLDTVNDKNLALSHQRKTNKILGNRVSELEKKIKTLEVAGLWNVSGNGHGPVQLEKLLQECNDMKTLIPQKVSHPDESDQLSVSEEDKDSELESVTPLDSLATTPDQSPTHTVKVPEHLELGDLDLLPTKEVTCKPAVTDNSTDSNLPGQKLHLLSSNAGVESYSLELSMPENSLPEQDLSQDFNKKNENAKDSFVMADSHEMIQTINEGSSVIESENPINNCNRIPNNNPKSDELRNGENNAKCNEYTDSTSNKDSSENTYPQSERLEVDKNFENLSSDTEDGSVKDCDKVHVYNEDKLEEQEDNKDTSADSGDIDRELDLDLDETDNQIDADLGEIRELSELIEMPVDLKAGGDANSMFITRNTKNADKHVHDISAEVEHIGENGDSENDDIETSERMGLLVESMAQKMCNISHKEVQRQGSTAADDDDDQDDTSKLLSDNSTTNEQDESSQTKVDEPHNVEC